MPGFLSRAGDWLRQPGAPEPPAPPSAGPDAPPPRDEASQATACDLHPRFRARGRNLCVSPFSVHAPFAREDGSVIQVPMMQHRLVTGYVERRGLQALDLAYQRSRWSMLVVSGMNGPVAPHEDALFISSVIHEATIDADEAGAEATAATALVMDRAAAPVRRRRPPPVPIFRADRPFLFVIRHRETGTIHFMGRVADPSTKN